MYKIVPSLKLQFENLAQDLLRCSLCGDTITSFFFDINGISDVKNRFVDTCQKSFRSLMIRFIVECE